MAGCVLYSRNYLWIWRKVIHLPFLNSILNPYFWNLLESIYSISLWRHFFILCNPLLFRWDLACALTHQFSTSFICLLTQLYEIVSERRLYFRSAAYSGDLTEESYWHINCKLIKWGFSNNGICCQVDAIKSPFKEIFINRIQSQPFQVIYCGPA